MCVCVRDVWRGLGYDSVACLVGHAGHISDNVLRVFIVLYLPVSC